MPSFYDLLKYAKTGVSSSDMTAYDKMRALAMAGVKYPVQTITGVPPISFRSDGSPLDNVTIIGNSQQTGTPTPDNPIMPEFVGERTANLFNATIVQGSFTSDGGVNAANTRVRSEFQSVPLEPGTYTISAVGMDYALHAAYSSADLATFDSSESNYSWAALPYTFTITQRRYICFAFRKENNPRIYPSDISNIMINTGSVAKPYQPYGYVIKITSAGQTVPVYLGEVPTVQRIRKIEFDGSENWIRQSVNDYGIANFQLSIPDRLLGTTETMLSSHFVRQTTSIGDTQDMGFYIGGGAGKLLYLRCDSSIGTYLSEFQAWLAAQKTNGTPVSFWYILETPETGIVNDPLCKIGDYADELHSADAGITIPTVRGSNVLTIETDLQPSEMSITGHIKPV